MQQEENSEDEKLLQKIRENVATIVSFSVTNLKAVVCALVLRCPLTRQKHKPEASVLLALR